MGLEYFIVLAFMLIALAIFIGLPYYLDYIEDCEYVYYYEDEDE